MMLGTSFLPKASAPRNVTLTKPMILKRVLVLASRDWVELLVFVQFAHQDQRLLPTEMPVASVKITNS